MDDVGNAQHRLSTRETIAKARVHLLENPAVTLRLAFAAHYGKLSGRVTWCIPKVQSPSEPVEGATPPDKMRETIDTVLKEATNEIKEYHSRRLFGTAVAVIERQGDQVLHTETEYDERILGWEDDSGRPRFRLKPRKDKD